MNKLRAVDVALRKSLEVDEVIFVYINDKGEYDVCKDVDFGGKDDEIYAEFYKGERID